MISLALRMDLSVTVVDKAVIRSGEKLAKANNYLLLDE